IPIILCDLEGKTRREAADQLGCPIGTVSGRLSRGRVLLAERLSRRERTHLGGSLPLVARLPRGFASPGVPTALVSSTVKAASAFGAGPVAAGVISAHVLALAEVMMRITMLKKLAILMVALWLCLAGGGLTYLALASGEPQAGPAASRDG